MPISWPTLAQAFDAYHALPFACRELHEATDADVLFRAAATKGTDPCLQLGAFAERINAWALYTGAVASCSLKPLDLLVGSGVNLRGAQAPLARVGARKYLREVAKAPCDTGLCGLVLGLHAGLCVAAGALAGASLGCLGATVYLALARERGQPFWQQWAPLVSTAAANGALVVGAGLAAFSGLILLQLLVGVFRTATAVLRGAVVCLGGCLGLTAAVLAGAWLLRRDQWLTLAA